MLEYIKDSLEDKSIHASSKKGPLFSLQFGQERNILVISFERRTC